MSRQPVVFSRNSRGRLFGENRVRTFSVGTRLPRAGLFITTWHYWTRVLVNKHATCFSAGTLSNFGHDARLVMAPSTVCRRRSVPVGVWLRTVFGHEEAESQGSQACKPWGSSPFGGEKETEVGDPNFVLSFLMLTYSPSNPDCHVLELGTGQLGKKMWKTRMLKCEGIFFHQPPLIGANHGMKIRCSGTRQSCPFGPQQTWKREANTFALSNIRIFATGKWVKKS